MTISAFCRDQLLAHGPLPLETLAELAAGAGTTTARDPASAVRSAIAYKEVLLADGRWATPLWLLEGRILTACRLPLVDTWPESDLGDEDASPYDPYLEDPDLEEVPHGSRHDLALLNLAIKSSSVPLATGGLLRGSPYGGGWRVPKGWPGMHPGRDQLLGLRVHEGQLHVELVPVTDELHSAGRRLARELGPLTARGQSWAGEDSLVSQNLAGALWNRMAADPEFLTSPVPPFSRCIPSLALAARREHDRRVAEASRWRPQLDLPADLQRVAVQQAWSSGQLLDKWLSACIARTLRKIGHDDLDDGYADVLPLQRDHRR
jgi:hypothetical protein